MASPFLSSINSGEFSPRMDARVDFERYPNAAKLCRNFTLYPQGGITRRPGTRFVKEVKDSTAATRLVPFEYSEDDSYQLEAGNNYFRVYRLQGAITVGTTDAAVTNGLFTSNITSWTNSSTGTAAIAHDATNGRLQLTAVSGSIAWASQAITISAGYTAVEHVLRFRIAGFHDGKVGFQVGTTATGSTILAETELGVGEHAIAFTPGATTFYIQFRAKNIVVQNMFVDNVAFLSNAAMEFVSPYATADLPSVAYFQSADVVYLTHSDYTTRKIERRGHRSWSIVEAPWQDGPWLEINDGADLTESQIMSNSLFDVGVNGWTDNSTGNAFVTYNEAGKFAELDPGTSAGVGLCIMRSSATVVSSKKHVIHILVLAAGPVTVNFGTSAGGTQYSTQTQQPGWTSYELTTSSTTLHVEFRYSKYDAGRAGIGACLVYSQDAKLLEPSGTTGSVTVDALGFTPFTSADVGRLLRFEWPGREAGYGVITAYSSTSSVTMLVLRPLSATTPLESWRFGAWGGDQGYPTVISFFDGRLVAANTEGKPNTLWFSQSGELENMRIDTFTDGATSVEATDAITVTLRSNRINPIFWVQGTKNLMVGTAGGEWVVSSSGAVITPSDISAKQHAAVPCANLRPVEINQTILFADRAKRQVHDLAFSLQEDSFLSTDLTVLSDHMFRSSNSLEEMVFQRAPYSLVWCRRADGRIASLSYNKQHQVLGWSQTIVGGSFGSGDAVVESISVIPGSSDSSQFHTSDERNELWMIVKRTINGSTKRYIEFQEYFYDGPLREDYSSEKLWRDAVRTSQADAFYVDSGLTYDSTATDVITGLNHLEGQTVKVLADGKVIADKVVSSGSITLPDTASTVHVGLSYKHRYEGLKLGQPGDGGASVNKVKIITAVGVVLLDASHFKITTTDYDEDGRRQNDLYHQRFDREWMDPADAVPLYTGELKPSTEGNYTTDTRIYIEGDDPLPFTLLGLAPQVEVRPV